MEIAEPCDVDPIRSLYDEASQRVSSKGGFIDWPNPFPVQRVMGYQKDASLYKFLENGLIAATIRMYENGNKDIWSDVDTAKVLYIGKIATSNKVSGRRYIHNTIFPQVLDHASLLGYDHIRFDSLATNHRQLEMYQNSIFHNVGEAAIRSYNTGQEILLAKWQYDMG